jgi:uncharacterized membrane protein
MKRAIGGIVMVLGVVFIILGLVCATLEASKSFSKSLVSKTQPTNVGAEERELSDVDKVITALEGLLKELRQSPIWLASVVVGILLVYIGYLMH